MTDRKKKKDSSSPGTSFGEAIGRITPTNPREVADIIARELAERMKETNERIKAAREDIKRGARSGKERFRI
jgi:hypothetical protein